MQSIDDILAAAGARADSTPSFVVELIKALEARIAELEAAAKPKA